MLMYWFICNVFQGQSALQTLLLNSVRGYCCFTTGVNHTLVLNVRAGDFTSEDPKLKMYAYCVYRSLTISNNDGTINKERAIPLLPERTDKDKFIQAVDACNGNIGTDKYDTAWKILQCYDKEYPGDIFAL